MYLSKLCWRVPGLPAPQLCGCGCKQQAQRCWTSSSRSGERFDQLLTRFDLKRHEAEMVGAGINYYNAISTSLLRAVGLSPEQLTRL